MLDTRNILPIRLTVDRLAHTMDSIECMDLLAEVLAAAGVRGTVAASVHASEPWGLELDRIPGAAFHAITAGTAWLRLPGRPDVRLMPGDVVLLPTGTPHALSSEQDVVLEPFDHLAAEQALADDGVLQVGSRPGRTRILCASYRHDPAVATPLLTLLPDLVHVPAGTGGAALDDTLRLLGNELTHRQLGAATVLDRLVDVLLIHLLRAWIDTESVRSSASLFRALGDPVIAAALSALHSDPARPWTIDSLADEVAVSRATLARRFPALVGDTPSAYLTRWRMDLAARRLRDTDDPIEQVAKSVGYTSVYAFSRAFSRTRTQPPGRYRVESRAADRGPGSDEPPPARPSL
ncbi:AraC family transcriptional regulator [Kribbella sp. NBC_01510]|uniref:AraC family transcriptional regulator n=1 Tax=unclassified Kribbella TaxID=2644121 RepID=UPI002E33C285|nr:AraC family transcriptional regulator [Kribbella sp. NBC_01484]